MSAPALPGILQAVAPYLDSYGYFAVAGFLLLENFGLPLPGETILIAAAVYAGLGKLNIFILAGVAIVAAVIGDNIGFAIGHYGGEKVVLKYGRYIFITKERLNSTQVFFNKYGGPVVMVARFIAGLRQLNGIVAGTAEMKWRTFLIFNAIGATLWVSVWTSVGYFAGNNIPRVYTTFHKYEQYVLILLVMVVVAYIVRKVIQNKQKNKKSA